MKVKGVLGRKMIHWRYGVVYQILAVDSALRFLRMTKGKQTMLAAKTQHVIAESQLTDVVRAPLGSALSLNRSGFRNTFIVPFEITE